MKNIIKSLALAAVVLVSGASFTACKKGENDPGISLASRTGRLVGKWNMTKGEIKETSGGTTTTETFEGTAYTYNPGGGSAITGTFVGTIEFEKGGVYTITQTRTIGGTAVTYTDKGNWSWVGKNKEQDLKNKEAVYLASTSFTSNSGGTTTTSTWTNPVDGSIWLIDQLKSKEMIIKYETAQSSGGSSSSSSVSWTLTQE